MQKVDIHVHCGTSRKTIGHATMPSVVDVLETVMGGEGAGHVVLMANPMQSDGAPEEDAYRKVCLEMRDIAATRPRQFSWFCNLDPSMSGFGSGADLVPLLQEYKDMGAVGFGETTVNLPWDDPHMLNLLGALEQVGLPILAHMDIAVGTSYGVVDDVGLPRLERALQAFPDLVIVGHSQVFWSEISADATDDSRGGYPVGGVTPGRLQELLATYPNLYADLSARSGYNALMRDPDYAPVFLEEFADKLMYGSDYLFPREPVRTGALLDELADRGQLSAPAHAKIVRENAIRVFGLSDRVAVDA